MSAGDAHHGRRYAPEAFLEALRAVGVTGGAEAGTDDHHVARTGEIAEHVGCARSTARRHLTRLADGETLAEPYSGWWWLDRYADRRHLLAHPGEA